jgi:hypothetical protein
MSELETADFAAFKLALTGGSHPGLVRVTLPLFVTVR